MDIHVVTAFKGGSGKTLIALALLANLGGVAKRLDSEIWAVDLNSTNPNFYEILDSPGKLDIADRTHCSEWLVRRTKSKNPPFKVAIARPAAMFQLPGTATDLWRNVSGLFNCLRARGEASHVIIDTDLNIINLIEAEAEQINDAVRPQDHLFLWNIWMPHYFVDEDIHIQYLIRADAFLREQAKINFTLVHVINEYLFSHYYRASSVATDSEPNVLRWFLRRIGFDRGDTSNDLLRLPAGPEVSAKELLTDLRFDGSMPAIGYIVNVLEDIYNRKGRLPCNIVFVEQENGLESYVRDFQGNISIARIEDRTPNVARNIKRALSNMEQVTRKEVIP